MSDLNQYINQRKQSDLEFAENFESGYLSFKLGILLAQAREQLGMSQEELAHRLNWDQATVSQVENNTESVNLVTLERYIKGLGKELILDIR